MSSNIKIILTSPTVRLNTINVSPIQLAKKVLGHPKCGQNNKTILDVSLLQL